MNHSLKITFKAAQARSASWPRYLSITRSWHPSGPSDLKTFAVKKPHQFKISVVIPVKKLKPVITSFQVVGSCELVTIELAKLSTVSIWRQSQPACPNFRSRLPSSETNIQTKSNKKIVSTFREICAVSNKTLYLHNLPAPCYSLRCSLTPLLVSSSSPMTTAIAFY